MLRYASRRKVLGTRGDLFFDRGNRRIRPRAQFGRIVGGGILDPGIVVMGIELHRHMEAKQWHLQSGWKLMRIAGLRVAVAAIRRTVGSRLLFNPLLVNSSAKSSQRKPATKRLVGPILWPHPGTWSIRGVSLRASPDDRERESGPRCHRHPGRWRCAGAVDPQVPQCVVASARRRFARLMRSIISSVVIAPSELGIALTGGHSFAIFRAVTARNARLSGRSVKGRPAAGNRRMRGPIHVRGLHA